MTDTKAVKHIYCLWDLVANARGGPLMEFHHDRAACRAFTDLLNTKDTVVSNHPEDFELRHLGTIDEDTGRIEPYLAQGHPATNVIMSGKQWKLENDSRKENR